MTRSAAAQACRAAVLAVLLPPRPAAAIKGGALKIGVPIQILHADHGNKAGVGAAIARHGRMVHDMLLVRVKAPAQSRYPWDYDEILATVPGAQAFRPLSETDCPYAR